MSMWGLSDVHLCPVLTVRAMQQTVGLHNCETVLGLFNAKVLCNLCTIYYMYLKAYQNAYIVQSYNLCNKCIIHFHTFL